MTSSALGAGLVALAGAALLAALGGTSFGGAFAQALGRESAPVRALGSAKLRTALLETGRIALRPPSGRDDCAGAELGVRALAAEEMPSSRFAPPAARTSTAPFVSVWLEPCGFERLDQHPLERGRAWEEVGWLSFFDGGRLAFATPVGVRVHGGESRGRRPRSYRLTFRPSLGAQPLPARLVASELGEPLDALIADANAGSSNDGVRWQFLDSIPLAVARRLGVDVPDSRPVRFSVNGATPQVYVLLERIGADWLERRTGSRDFDLVRSKQDGGQPPDRMRAELFRAIDSPSAPLQPAVIAADFDLDSLVDGFVTALYCATGDLFQATIVRDPRRGPAGGRWRFVPWDLDQSFRDPGGFARFKKERDVLAWTFHRKEPDALPAGRLLRRLLLESPAFRRQLAQRTTDDLNHLLTAGFALELVARHRELAVALAIDDLRFLDQLDGFLAARPTAIYAQLARFLDVGAPVVIEVAAPEGSVRIDGFEAALPYRGLYPTGLAFTLDVEPAWREQFLGVEVDGTVHLLPDGHFELEARQPAKIVALFRDAPAASGYGSRKTG